MHILLLNDDALPEGKGGAAVIVDRLRRHYARNGHRVTLITTHQTGDGKDIIQTTDEAGETISLPVHIPSSDIHRHCVSVAPVSRQLEQILRELRPDVAHAHNVHSYLTYDSLRIAYQFTGKVFLTAHDSYLISFARVGGDAYRKAALAGKPYHMHWWNHLMSAGRTYSPDRNAKIRLALKESLTTIVVYSHAMEKFLHDHGMTKTTFVRGGIDVSAPPPNSDVDAFKEKCGIDGLVILFGGRISGDKGIDALLKAAERVVSEVPNVNLLIAGDRKRLDPHMKNATAAVQNRIRTTGWIDTKEMESAYAAADIVTTPSIYLDNFPTINLEAMAAAKPVVGTCFGGTPELVVDGVTGFVRNPLETENYADAMTALLKDPALAQKMGQAGQKRVETEFSMKAQAQAYLELFTK